MSKWLTKKTPTGTWSHRQGEAMWSLSPSSKTQFMEICNTVVLQCAGSFDLGARGRRRHLFEMGKGSRI